MSFFSELKRRHVFRVALAYVLAGWLILQVADVVLPILGAPNWVAQILLASLAIGFIIAVLLAWFYEMTPQGLRRIRPTARIASAIGLLIAWRIHSPRIIARSGQALVTSK